MRPRIATKLTFLLIPLILLPFGSLAYYWYSSTRAALEAQVRDEFQARLRQFGLRLRPFLRERALDLEDLATSPVIEDYHTQLEYRLLEEAEVARRKLADYLVEFARRRRGFVADIRYLNERGIEVAGATPDGLHPGQHDRSQMPFFQRARGVTQAVPRRELIGQAILDSFTKLDPRELEAETPLRDQLDIDSMDFLNFTIGLHKAFGIEIPEADSRQLATLAGCVNYLAARIPAK